MGVINERDLFALQRVSMRQVIEGLHAADSIDELKRAGDDIRRLTQNLLAQGVGAEPLTRTIASLNDALSRRAIELVLERHDLADVDWCWLALGSEGRGEQTFATDQDNALLFSAADDRRRPTRSASGCSRSRATSTRALDALGFPLCTGNVMASNPELCLSTEEWKAKFLAWIRAADAAGAAQRQHRLRLPAALRRHDARATRCAHGSSATRRRIPMFLRLMVQNALEVEPPLGLIRAFAVDDEAGVKGTLDLKARGTRLFVDCARVFALAHGIAETGTAARLRLAGERLHVEPRHVDATVEAFHFLQFLRLRQQDLAGGAGQPEPHRPVRAARDRPADAEGGVPAGEAAAGAAAAVLPAVTTGGRRLRS